ncbi:MAG: rRNA maturation RNase YbeY [SAR202 cluster bacterium]|nr:rRNA maturation RNase YbeY [SAR202 cluster bacterium]MDP6511984.1 rRNA maturation RNase YbeY [SAR202 cluster bacterium]MDP6714231.1 rRNA maturation RNase YbeY [SAR202 cluster bacterium]
MSISSPPPNVSVQVFEEQSHLIDGGWIGHVAAAALDGVGVSGEGLSVVITDDDTVAELNRTHRGLDETTDVLSFSYAHSGTFYGDEDQKPEPAMADEFILPPAMETDLGEIVISYPQAERQASQAEHTVEKELVVLLAHGILHLLGYDHEDDDEAAEMKIWEEKAFAAIESGGYLIEAGPGR